MSKLGDYVRIVLVEPVGPLNVGSVARVMKNFGLHQLVLVNPQCDPHAAEAQLMAVKARDLLAHAQQVPTLQAALAGCQQTVATIGRDCDLNRPVEFPAQVTQWLAKPLNGQTLTGALVFGREDSGLTNDELAFAQRLIRIPSDTQYPSLNLAQAVGICCYELNQQWQAITSSAAAATLTEPDARSVLPPQMAPPAPSEVVEGYYQHLETLLLKIGFLYPHTAASRMEKLRYLYQRSQVSSQEVALLRGMLRQMEWALRDASTRNESESNAECLPRHHPPAEPSP